MLNILERVAVDLFHILFTISCWGLLITQALIVASVSQIVDYLNVKRVCHIHDACTTLQHRNYFLFFHNYIVTLNHRPCFTNIIYTSFGSHDKYPETRWGDDKKEKLQEILYYLWNEKILYVMHLVLLSSESSNKPLSDTSKKIYIVNIG